MPANVMAANTALRLAGFTALSSSQRVKTIAGSMRMTLTMAAMADRMHMSTVSTKIDMVSSGVHDDGQGRLGGLLHDDETDDRGNGEADHRAQQRLTDDHLVNVHAGRSNRASVANSLR